MTRANPSLPPLSRRRALTAALGAFPLLNARLRASEPPVRMAISESLAGDVNRNDARIALQLWLQKLAQTMDIALEVKVLATTEEIVQGSRAGSFDAVAVNVLEYLRIADLMDSSQIVSADGGGGLERYCILTKQSGGFRHLGDLKGRRLFALKDRMMCVAPYWLGNLLEEAHSGPADRFFGSVISDTKVSRVILPVFFGQADACLTTSHSFEVMCELNPQVGRDLQVISISAPMVVAFYIFRKNCRRSVRDLVFRALTMLDRTAAGQQIGTLFNSSRVTIRDARSLASALATLEAAERNHVRPHLDAVKEKS